jgi:hypothetical protein
VAPISGALLASWWLVLTVQMATAGAVLGAAAAQVPLRQVARWVLGGALLLVVATIILQNTGIAPQLVE